MTVCTQVGSSMHWGVPRFCG